MHYATTCPLDCPDACSLTVEVDDGRLVALDGDRRNRLTQGFICDKVRRIANHVYDDARLRVPAIRRGPKGNGTWSPISWDEALDTIATKFSRIRDEFGGEAILPFAYGGSNGKLTHGPLDERLFRRLGASQLAQTVCAAPSSRAAAGLYGQMPGIDLGDYVHASLIVLWGVNPSASGIHMVPIVREAQRRGARLVVVDPRRIPLATKADLHLPIRPGTDVIVALAVIHWLFERGYADLKFLADHATGSIALRERASAWSIARAAAEAGIPSADLERFAIMYAETSPTVIRCGWGPERNRNGGSSTAAILALPAVGGKFGTRGGGYTMSNSHAFPLDLETAIAEPKPEVRTVNMNRLGRALTELDDPPVKMLFNFNCNPLATMPNQTQVRRGLMREDLFTVVFDQVMTDTARYADIVLPATTFLEHDDLVPGYGAIVLGRTRPVLDRVGEARPNLEVFAELIKRCGLDRPDDLVTPEALAACLTDSIEGTDRLDADLRNHGVSEFAANTPTTPFIDRSPQTPDGKIHLCPPELDLEAKAAGAPDGLYSYRAVPHADPAFPLFLISPASTKTVNSTFGQLQKGPATVKIHPDDAKARGIASGQTVRVFNRLGETICLADIDEVVRPGVAVMAKGLWSHHTFNGYTSNAVVPDHLTDLGGGAAFNDTRVDIARAAQPDARSPSD